MYWEAAPLKIAFGTWYEFESETQSGIESETVSGTQYEIELVPKYKSADVSLQIVVAVCRCQFADCSLFVAAKNVNFNSWYVVQNEE